MQTRAKSLRWLHLESLGREVSLGQGATMRSTRGLMWTLLLAACGTATTTTEDAGGTVAPDVVATDSASGDAKDSAAEGTDAATDAPAPDRVQADTGQPDAGLDTAAPAFSEVQAIFDARCINCHSATALGLPGYAKLPLTSDVSYAKLVNQPALEACGKVFVVPGTPADSYLFQKVSQDAPCSGGRMPAKFEIMPAPALTDAQLVTIQQWIAGGAKP